MSRSRRKTPIIGFAADSDRWYKKYRAGKERARLKALLRHQKFDEAMFVLVPWDWWDSCKDGKLYLKEEYRTYQNMRK